MTIQDLLDWCKGAKAPTHPDGYPLSARLLLSEGEGEDADGITYDLCIVGCEGHGHKWEEPESITLAIRGKNK